jgi:L-alanine-DL-glutamate epimerase-like enolase superfamily enzyme
VSSTPVTDLRVSAYTVPTEQPESDGTLDWSATTIVVAEPTAGGRTGLGFTYSSPAAGVVIEEHLREVVLGADAMDVPGAWSAMVRAIRNLGRPGIASAAIAAVDIALWDLKAKLVGVALVDLLGAVRDAVPVYGSGGFTSLSDQALCGQLGHWVHERHIPRVKMKVGTGWGSAVNRDLARVAAARTAVGGEVELYVDANGAFSPGPAIRFGQAVADLGVTWFEEPVSSDDLAGLAQVRAAIAADVAAGEYGSDLVYFQRMCAAGSVDVLQVDVSRCAGITEWRRAAAVAAAHGLEVSGHCAQSLHVHPACTVPNLRHLEHFYDHERLDRLLFDGVLDPSGGVLRPDRGRPGLGLELKAADAQRFAA